MGGEAQHGHRSLTLLHPGNQRRLKLEPPVTVCWLLSLRTVLNWNLSGKEKDHYIAQQHYVNTSDLILRCVTQQG